MSQPTTEDLHKLHDQLQDEIREARGTLKDLRYEIKTARALAENTRQLTAELAETQIRDLLEKEVVRQVTALGEQTSEQMRKSVAKVIAEFDKLRDLLLGHDRVTDGREERSIPDLLQDPAILARARHAAIRNAREADRE